MSSDDDTEEIVEEIHNHSDSDENISNSEREPSLFPFVALQTGEKSASNLLELGETVTGDEYERNLDPRSLSPDAKDFSYQPSQFEGHSINSESIPCNSLTKQNETEEEKELEEEEVASKRSHKSSFQNRDHMQKSKIFKSCSGNELTRSSDASPVSSDWSAESFKTQSSGSNSIYIKDRSVSEISVSVPKLSVFSLDSAQKVKSLVKQFSSQDEETDVPSIGSIKSVPRQLSLPVELFRSTSAKNSFVSLQQGEKCSSVVEGCFDTHSHKDCVSCMVCYFQSQEKEKHSSDKGYRELPRKFGQLSPRVKASLEKIGTCLSRGSSLDSQTSVEERKILKSKENIKSRQKTSKVIKPLHVSEKENSPCHKAKLKESLERIYEKKDHSQEKAKDSPDTGILPSWSSSCQSSPTKERRAVSLTRNLHDDKGEKGCENSKNLINSKATNEDICDTEEEVEDMPEEKDQKIASGYVDKEDDCVCFSEEELSVANSHHLDSANSSLEPSNLHASCDGGGKIDHCALIYSHAEFQEEKLSSNHYISSQKNKEDVPFGINRIVETPLNHFEIDYKDNANICDTEEDDMLEEKDGKLMSDYVDEGNDSVCLSKEKMSLGRSPHLDSANSSLEPAKLQRSCGSNGKAANGVVMYSHSGSQEEEFFGRHTIPSQKGEEDASLAINKMVETPLNHSNLEYKDSVHFCAAESLNQSSESKVQIADVSHLNAFDAITSNSGMGIVNASKEDNCFLQAEKRKKNDLQLPECQSQSEFSLSLENESCDELLHIDIDHSGDDLFASDFSDASEIVMGLISKSPISAITERTEESGQEIENLNHRLEKESDLCSNSNIDFMNDLVAHTDSGNECQNIEQKVINAGAIEGPIGEKHYPSLPFTVVNDESSQFTGISSAQEGSLVQTHVSLQVRSEPVHTYSSHPSASAVGQSSSKLGTKAKLPVFAGYGKTSKRFEKNATPPLSPTIKSPSGPVRATLHRSASKSMHNLASNHGSKSKTQGLQNRSMSVSTDSLERNSLRAKSLSPGPLSRQTVKCGSDSGGQGNLNRRCISAIALNEGEGHINLKRNKSFSLSKLNRSRSSSLTSIASSRKIDYSQIPSKVRQYIKDMKEKDLRNSTRSLPSTPARRSMQQMASQTIILDEKFLRELSQLDESNMPNDMREIRKQILGEKCDRKRHEEILNLLINERKLRHASDTTLATLQLHYDNLNARFAEKQNEIDRLRFYKDIHISKEYTISIKSQEEGRCNKSHNTTRPNTPGRYADQYGHTPSLSERRSSYATPPNSPNIRSFSPTITSSNLIKTTLTPITDPKLSIVYDPSISHVFEDSIQGDKTSNQPVLSDQKKIGDLEITGSSQGEVCLQSWMKDASNLLNKLKEFALLEGSAVLQQSERSIIWSSILHQYWCLSSQFPVLTLLPSSHEPGHMLQELGQSLQATASRFDLDLAARKYQEGELIPSDIDTVRSSGGDIGGMKGKSSNIHAAGSRKFVKVDSSEDRSKKLVSIVNEQRCYDRDITVQNSGNSRKTDVLVCKKDVTEEDNYSALHYSPAKRTREQLSFHGNTLMKKIEDVNENLTELTQKSSDTPHKVDTTEDPVLLPDVASLICEYDSKKSLINQKTMPAKDLYPHMLEGPLGHGFVSEKIDTSPAAVCSPAHSRESMKTVGPLEKVKLWQASLIDPEVPHTAYQSSSDTSPAPSILSLDSSHPFDPHEDINNSLTSLQHDPAQMPLNTGKTLSTDCIGILKNVKNEKVNNLQGHTVESNSPLQSPERMECDLPKCSWRSNSMTPRLPWGRTVKARDLDSGCPGSEQSTRVSHNASLDQPEQLDFPNLQSSLDATNNNEEIPEKLIQPLQISRCENEEHADDCVSNEPINKSGSRCSTHSCYEDKELEHEADLSPSIDLVTMAFPTLGACQVLMDNKKSRTLSGSRSSRNSSKNRRDHCCRYDEQQDVKDKTRNEIPWSSDYSIRDESQRGTNSRNSKVSKDSVVNERNSHNQDTEFNSGVLHTHQRTKLKKLPEMKALESNEKSRGRHSDKTYESVRKEQNIKRSITSSLAEENHLSQKKSCKYSAKYVNRNSSDTSDMSISSHNIHNNISKLKRDLNIIKSQMMNLTSEVFHENKRKSKGGCKGSSNNQTSYLEGRQKPIKALDVSVYSDDCEHDSDITVQSFQAFKDPKSSCSRYRTSMLIKTGKPYRSFPSDRNLQDCQGDTSVQFSNSSMDMLSESFLESKMERLPKSTPNSKESQFKEQKTKSLPNSVNNRVAKTFKDMKKGYEIKRKLCYENEVETTEIREQDIDCKKAFGTVPFSHLDTKHVSVQTESKVEGSHICKSIQTASANKTSDEVKNESSQTKHQGSQSILVPDAQLISAAAPVIYIQNYNCGSKPLEANPLRDNEHKTSPHDKGHSKHRRAGSAHELMVSLDEATTLAERLRLRSENMLSYLNLHFTVHSNLNSS